MKIAFSQFLGKNHSWSIVGQNLARSFIEKKNIVDLFSTNGISSFPTDLKPYLKGYYEEPTKEQPNPEIIGSELDKDYDMQISYTSLKNATLNLSNGSKNRFLIWCYEFTGKNAIPSFMTKHYSNCDKLIAPSVQAKQVFIDSGIPKDHIHIIPHGVDDNFINSTKTYPLNTNKKFKFLCNLGQAHKRKNIKNTIEAYYKAFTDKDDVCFVLKYPKKPALNPFECNVDEILNDLNKKYLNHPEILKLNTFIPDIDSLYRSCNAYVLLSNAESFGMPALETLACKKILITSNYGGMQDFCTDNNSLLVPGKVVRAPADYLYWTPTPNHLTGMFQPNIDIAAEKMIYAVKNEKALLNQFNDGFEKIIENYTWDKVSDLFMEIAK